MIKNGIIYVLLGVLKKSIPFLLLPIIARYLSPNDFGYISVFTTSLAFLGPFVHFQMGSYVVINYYEKPKTFTRQLLSNIIIVSFVVAVLLTVLIIPFSQYFSEVLSIPVWMILALPATCYVVNVGAQNMLIQRNKEKPFVYGAFSITETLITLGTTLLLVAYLGFGWQGRVFPIMCIPFVFFFIHIYHLRKQGLFSFRVDFNILKDTLLYSFPLVPTVFGISAINMADRYFIQIIEGEYELGVYSIGYTFGMIISFMTSAFEMAFVPFIYKILSNKDALETNKVRLVQFTYLYLVVILGLALVFSYASYVLIDFGFLPESYVESKEFIFWVAMGYVFWAMMNIVGVYIALVKKTKYIFYTLMFGVSTNMVLNYVLIKQLGAIGAAYSTAATFLITLIVYWIISYRVYPMPWLDKRILHFSIGDLKKLFEV